MIGRLVLMILAAAALAWCILGLRETRLENAAGSAAGALGAGSPQRIAQARWLLHRAADLSSDRQPQFRELQLLLLAGRASEALALARRLAAAEPENGFAWFGVAAAAQSLDPPLAARARARLHQLSPPVR
jgi:hypothetical protein